MSLHTPGPWQLSKSRDYVIETVDGSYPICTYEMGSRTEPEDLANARLIALCPEMFQVLKNIVSSAPIRGLPLALELDIQAACNLINRVTGKDGAQ